MKEVGFHLFFQYGDRASASTTTNPSSAPIAKQDFKMRTRLMTIEIQIVLSFQLESIFCCLSNGSFVPSDNVR
jgi:hypothetical protein